MKELDWRTHVETLRELTTSGAVISALRLRELVALLNPVSMAFPDCASERRQLIDFLEAALNHPLAETALGPTAMAEVPFGATRDELLMWLAGLYGDDGELERAITTVDEAIAVGYDSPAYAKTGVVDWLLRLGRDAEAAELAASVVAENPEDPWLYFNLGQEYARIGRHEHALDLLTAGVRRALEAPDRFCLETLISGRGLSLGALGRKHDRLQQRAIAALADRPGRSRT